MLEAQGLKKIYRKKAALEGASFTLSPGETLGVAGHNGSGKTTLLSIVSQMQAPDGGLLLHDGKNVLGDRAFMRAMMGYVPQKNCLLNDATVHETLHFFAKAYGVDTQALYAPGKPAAVFGLEEFSKKRIAALSGGMQKRVSIALALLHEPRYLLLDEAFSALDIGYRNVFKDWMRGYLSRGGALLYCSHEVEELETFCDRLLVLRNGHVVFYDEIARFPTDEALRQKLLNPLQTGK